MCDHRNIWLPWCGSVYRKQHNAASVTVKCDVPMSCLGSRLSQAQQPDCEESMKLQPRNLDMSLPTHR